METNFFNDHSLSSDCSSSPSQKEYSLTQTTQAQSNFHPIPTFAHLLRSHNILIHTSLQQNSIPIDSFIFLTPSMQKKMHSFGRVCRLFIISDCLEGEKGHDKICLIIGLNQNLCPTILSAQTFNSLKITEQKAVIYLLQFLKEKTQFVPQTIFLHQSLHQAVRKFNCLEYQKIAYYHTFIEISHKIKQLFRTPTHSIFQQKFIQIEIDDLIEGNDSKKCQLILRKLKKIDRTKYQILVQQMSKKLLIFSQFGEQYVGLMYSKRFNQQMQNFVGNIAKMKFQGLQSLISVISSNEYYQKRNKNKINESDTLIIQNDNKLNAIKERYQQKPFLEFVKMYKKSLPAKYKKASNFMYIVSGRRGTPWLVEKTEKIFAKTPTFDWKCECLYLEKTGIPCEHLIKVLTIQKLRIDQYMDKKFERKKQQIHG